MNKICIENVTQRFPLPGKKELIALENIALSIENGAFIALIGESGCGKSTLLNLIAGLMSPYSGRVLVNGEVVTEPHHSRMMMFQQPCLLPWLTVEENIAFGCKLRGADDNLSEKVSDLIRLIGLEGFEKVSPDTLSVGMLPRAALARSSLGNPDILLMDEAFSDVDFFTRFNLLALLQDLWQSLNLTVILVTHDIDEALLLAQRIVLMGDRPGTIKHIFDIDIPYPRDVWDTKIHEKRFEILAEFKSLT